jgi:DNA-binding NarL/FixJ family response regulator
MSIDINQGNRPSERIAVHDGPTLVPELSRNGDHPRATIGDADHPASIPSRAITVSIINDYELVVRGVAAMLAPFEARIRVLEAEAGQGPSASVDVALFDTFAGRRHTLSRAAEMVRQATVRHVVLYTWDAAPAFVRAAADVGVSGVVLKTRSAEVLVDSIERIVAGERVGFDVDASAGAAARMVDLSDRESEVLALIAKGLTNAQIAEELYLSIETVKTYVKRLYAKLDVHNRAQAAVAASSHQLTPRH